MYYSKFHDCLVGFFSPPMGLHSFPLTKKRDGKHMIFYLRQGVWFSGFPRLQVLRTGLFCVRPHSQGCPSFTAPCYMSHQGEQDQMRLSLGAQGVLHWKLTQREAFSFVTVISLSWFGILEYFHLPLGQNNRKQSKPVTKLFRVGHIWTIKRTWICLHWRPCSFLTLTSSGTDSTGGWATQTAVLKAKCVNEPACLDSLIVLLINQPYS